MGRVIAALVEDGDAFQVTSVFETPEAVGRTPDYGREVGYTRNPVVLTSDAGTAAGEAEVVLDFALPAAFDEVVKACEDLRKPLVTGTTGIPDKEAKLRGPARRIPVVSAPNMSVGMNVVFDLCDRLGGVLGNSADLEIVEAHHRSKKDVPSGTAMEIARILGERTGKPIMVGRASGAALRGKEIAIHSLRAADVAGNHSVIFASMGETLEISHSARSRVCFGEGALRAASFVKRARPGLYDMLDVLGLRSSKEGPS
jgi:4-hydroxy-tetrahydrodipicolinate reductase